MFELVELVVLCFLSAASMQDLRRGEVYNFTFLLGFGTVLLVRVFLEGVSVWFGMGVGVVVYSFLPYLLYRKGFLGLADVYAVGLIGMVVPWDFLVEGFVVVAGVSVLYNVVLSSCFGKKCVRILPGVTVGYILTILVI